MSLGRWNSPESRQEHARICAEVAVGRPASKSGLVVNELLVLFLQHAETHYRRPDGTPTSEIYGYKSVIKLVRETHGHVLAADFGIAALKVIRQRMIDLGWCRRTINQATWRVKKVFKWGAGEGHVPPAVFRDLQVVGGLQVGRSKARESATGPTGAAEGVAATLPLLTRPVAGMIRLQQATGMRPGEAVCIRRADIDVMPHPAEVDLFFGVVIGSTVGVASGGLAVRFGSHGWPPGSSPL